MMIRHLAPRLYTIPSEQAYIFLSYVVLAIREYKNEAELGARHESYEEGPDQLGQ